MKKINIFWKIFNWVIAFGSLSILTTILIIRTFDLGVPNPYSTKIGEINRLSLDKYAIYQNIDPKTLHFMKKIDLAHRYELLCSVNEIKYGELKDSFKARIENLTLNSKKVIFAVINSNNIPNDLVENTGSCTIVTYNNFSYLMFSTPDF